MVGDNAQAPALLEGLGGSGEELLQGAHLVVYFDSQGLVHFGQVFMLRERRQGSRNGIAEVAGGEDLRLGACGNDELRKLVGAVHLTVDFEDPFQFFLRIRIDNVGSGLIALHIHSHIEGPVKAERETSFGGIELVGADAKVGQYSVQPVGGLD